MIYPIHPDKNATKHVSWVHLLQRQCQVSILHSSWCLRARATGPNRSLINPVNHPHQNQQHKNSNPGKTGLCQVDVTQESVSRRWCWRLGKTNVQYEGRRCGPHSRPLPGVNCWKWWPGRWRWWRWRSPNRWRSKSSSAVEETQLSFRTQANTYFCSKSLNHYVILRDQLEKLTERQQQSKLGWHHTVPCGLSAGSRRPSPCSPWLSPHSWSTGWCCFRPCWPFRPAGGPAMTNPARWRLHTVIGAWFTWASTSMARYWNMSWRSLMLLSSFRISSCRDSISLRACLVALASLMIWNTKRQTCDSYDSHILGRLWR